MKKYQSYKPSKIDWIGEIPTSWEVRKFRFLFVEKKSTQNLSLNSGSISFGQVIYKDDEGIPQERKETYQEVLKGEFLINPLNLNFDLKSLRIGLSEIDVVVSPGYIVLKLNEGLNKGYFKYLLRTFDTQQMKSLGNGVRQTISFKHLSSEELILPPVNEQLQIVNYLDEKIELVDKLISTKERKIILLKEQRISLINQIVTKGLNPNVKTKDCGVEWIGVIPENWKIGKLKHHSELNISSVDKHIFDDEISVQVCNYTDVYYNELISNSLELRTGSCTSIEYNKFLLKKGDVIITKDSESPSDIGVPSLVIDELDNVVCGYHLSIIKSNLDSLLGGYLFRQLQTTRVRRYFEVNSNGITRFGLGKSSVLELPLILPPIKEQIEIVKYLDSKTKEIDDLVQLEQKKIDLLKEYRQSLISEVVTGKVKVTQ
jgi:type I restriction enzyme S subunit